MPEKSTEALRLTSSVLFTLRLRLHDSMDSIFHFLCFHPAGGISGGAYPMVWRNVPSPDIRYLIPRKGIELIIVFGRHFTIQEPERYLVEMICSFCYLYCDIAIENMSELASKMSKKAVSCREHKHRLAGLGQDIPYPETLAGLGSRTPINPIR